MKHIILCIIFISITSLQVRGATVGINGGACAYDTIQDAVDAASSGDTIQVSAGTYNENISISSKNLTISGDYASDCSTTGGGLTTVNGGGISCVFYIAGSDITLQQLQITGGDGDTGGGLEIDSTSQVTLDHSNLFSNNAIYGGGAYIYPNCHLILNQSTIHDNTATADGGGARVWGTLTANDDYSDITKNSALNGGGFSVPGGTVNLNTADMHQNEATDATGKGGAIHVFNGGEITTTNSSMIGYLNQAYDGGGIYADGSTVTTTGYSAILRQNIAANNGGSIYLTNSSVLTLNNTDLGHAGDHLKNEAVLGAGIYAEDSTVNLNNTRAAYNTATSGGAIYMSNSTLDAVNCKFHDNKASENGGAIAASSSTLNIRATSFLEESSSLYNNTADIDENDSGDGGAIYTSDSDLTITQTYLHHNSAYRGGAIYQTGSGASAEVSNCLIHHNTVTIALGAGIRNEDGDFSITHTTITDNTGGAGFSGTATSAYNNIAWNNDVYDGFKNTPTDYGCNIDNGENAGSNVDPLFISPGSGEDYHLQEGSPARNACSTAGLLIDLENQVRPNETGYDMGAYEFYLPEYTVSAITDPAEGGSVSGTGTFVKYSSTIMNTTANPGYVFNHWSDGSRVLSCNDSYSYTVTGEITLLATFSEEQSEYTVSSAVSSANHGTVTGEGTFSHGASVTMTAIPGPGYTFSHWIETWSGFEGSCIVSTDEEYTFTADSDRHLIAVFRPNVLPGVLMLLLDDD